MLAFDALWSTVRLCSTMLIQGGAITQSAEELLQAGAVVSISNNFSRSRCCTGSWTAADRPRGCGIRAASPISPSRKSSVRVSHPRDGKPQFFDDLYLAVTNATAFSPTDVMPLAGWSKSAMAVQALISLTVLGLVVARAINVLS